MKFTVETIIFDLDGTLVNTGQDIASATNYTLQTFGLSVLPVNTIVNSIGGGAEVLLRHCLAERAGELINQALPIFYRRYGEFCCVETHLYPGVREILDHFLAVGKKMALATQKGEAITHEIIKILDIAHYFDILIGPESVTHRKPHPESVLRILDKLATTPDCALMVGDMVSDIQAGKSAGTLTCGVLYGFGAENDILSAHPDFIISNPAQMRDQIN